LNKISEARGRGSQIKRLQWRRAEEPDDTSVIAMVREPIATAEPDPAGLQYLQHAQDLSLSIVRLRLALQQVGAA